MVYVDEERPLFEQYKIVAIPTQVFLNAEGKEMDRHLGALPKEEVIKKLKELKFIRQIRHHHATGGRFLDLLRGSLYFLPGNQELVMAWGADKKGIRL